MSLCRGGVPTSSMDDGAASVAFPSAAARANGRLITQHQQTDRDADGVASDEYFGNDRADHATDIDHRTVYRHVSDGTSSSSSTDGGGWIIGGSRRRASAGTHKYYQDKQREPDDKPPQQWSSSAAGPEVASSLSEVQVVVHQSPVHRNDQQQSADASSKWYSKRLSYVTKSSPAVTVATPTSQQPVAAGSNAVLLAEVLGQKSGFNTTAGKGASAVGYYGQTNTGSKGFQNDLMDMLGKSMCQVRFYGTLNV